MAQHFKTIDELIAPHLADIHQRDGLSLEAVKRLPAAPKLRGRFGRGVS
jgi:hypothetical protein